MVFRLFRMCLSGFFFCFSFHLHRRLQTFYLLVGIFQFLMFQQRFGQSESSGIRRRRCTSLCMLIAVADFPFIDFIEQKNNAKVSKKQSLSEHFHA